MSTVDEVEAYLLRNYPPKAIEWIRDAKWSGPVDIPQWAVNYHDEPKWAAAHQPETVERFARKIKAGTGHTNPVVMVKQAGNGEYDVVDGHHRTLAYRKLDRPVRAYVGKVSRGDDRWEETHSSQFHSGSSPANKTATPTLNKAHVYGVVNQYAAPFLAKMEKGLAANAEAVSELAKGFSSVDEGLTRTGAQLDRAESMSRHPSRFAPFQPPSPVVQHVNGSK